MVAPAAAGLVTSSAWDTAGMNPAARFGWLAALPSPLVPRRSSPRGACPAQR